MITLGINAAFHDSAAALVVDGRLVAAAEEEAAAALVGAQLEQLHERVGCGCGGIGEPDHDGRARKGAPHVTRDAACEGRVAGAQ